MKLLVDMNLSPRWVTVLAEEGIHAADWGTVGRSNAPDPEIMLYARTNGFIVLTHDLDFGAILAVTQLQKPSVVQIRGAEVSPSIIGSAVLRALRQMAEELEAGALITVDPRRAKLRLLPLSGTRGASAQ
jgi:predicted nuclease of predicted toxin-antitoxin system